MGAGRVVFIALVTSLITSSATYFGLRAIITARARRESQPAVVAAPATDAAVPRPSKPAPRVAIPRVSGLSLVDALRALMNERLRVERIARRSSDTVPAEQVIGSEPPEGTMIDPDHKIDLVVSTGASAPEPDVASKVVVPKVRGRGLAAAKRALEAAGFSVRTRRGYDEDRREGVILRTSPKEGSEAPAGSTVVVTVNRFD